MSRGKYRPVVFSTTIGGLFAVGLLLLLNGTPPMLARNTHDDGRGGGVFGGGSGHATYTGAFPMRWLIPLYSCPSDQGGEIWEQVAQAAGRVSVTAIWGVICEEDDYAAALERLGAAGVQRLAYVATSDGQRPPSEVQAEIDFYRQYPMDGFFFDEVNPAPERGAYYAALIAYAKSGQPEVPVILNASYAPPSFVENTPADVVIILENTWVGWLRFDPRPYAALPSQQLAALVHTTSVRHMSRALQMAQERHIGWFYVTDRGWDELPSYFQSEVAWLVAQMP